MKNTRFFKTYYFNLHYESGMLYDTGPKSTRRGILGPSGPCTIKHEAFISAENGQIMS
jgi:hypothetical protein